MVKKKVSTVASSSLNRRVCVGQLKAVSGEGVGHSKKVLNKGKKKVIQDPVFEEEEPEDTTYEYDEDDDADDDAVDDAEDDAEDDAIDDADDDVDKDADEEEDFGKEDEETEEIDQARVQGLLMKVLQQTVLNSKRKVGGGVGKKKVKRVKAKPDLNVGKKVMEKGVVKTQSRRTQKALNLNGVKAFSSLVVQFDESRQKVVTEMGFGSMLKIPLTFFPRKFAYWLLTRVGEDGSVMFGDGYVFPLSPVQIQCVFGIRMGSRQVPSKTPEDDDVKVEVKRINGLFTKGDSISLPVAGAAMFRWNSNAELVPLRSEADKSHFKIAFLIVVLRYLLCPTTNTSKLAASLTPALSLYKETAEYDGCSWTLDWLCVAANKF